MINSKAKEIIKFNSAHEAARFVNGNASAIIACCKGRKKQYKGFIWRYANGN